MNRYKKYVQAVFLSITLLLGLSISQASNLSIEIVLGDDIHHIKRNPVYNLIAVSTPLTVEIYDFDFNQIAVLGRNNRTGKSDTSIAWKPDGLQIAVENNAEIAIWIFDPLTENFQQNVIIPPSSSVFRGISAIDWGDQLAVMYTYQPFGLNAEEGQIDIINDETWTLVSSIETDGSSFSLIQPMYMLEISPANNEVLSGINYCPSWPMECGFPNAFIAHTASLEVTWFQEDTDWIEDIGWSPNGSMFAFSASKVFIYEANTKQLIWEWSESKYSPVFIEWNHKNDQILAVNERGEAWLLDIASQQAVRTLDVPGFVKTITWDSANDRLYIGTVDRRLVVQCVICSELPLSTSVPTEIAAAVSTETTVSTLTATPIPNNIPTPSLIVTPIILDVGWSPDGTQLAYGGRGGDEAAPIIVDVAEIVSTPTP